MEEYRRLCRWEDSIKMDLKEIGVDVTMEMMWKNTVGGDFFINSKGTQCAHLHTQQSIL